MQFRQAAVEAFARSERPADALLVLSPTSRALAGILFAMVSSAIALACWGHVEVTSRAAGVLGTPADVETLYAPMAGHIAKVHVKPGEEVDADARLLTLSAPELQATYDEATHVVETLEAEAAHREETIRLERATLDTFQDRMDYLRERIEASEERTGRLRRRLAQQRGLVRRGLVAEVTLDPIQGTLEDEAQQRLSLQEQVRRGEAERAQIERGFAEAQSGENARLEQARARQASAAAMLAKLKIRAAAPGRLESMRVREGQAVRAGELLARVVPEGRPESVVAYLPERDRAFLNVGATVRMELAQLPVGEFGSAGARVERIAAAPASRVEMADVLGEGAPPGPHYQLLLDLDWDDPGTRALTDYLRPGAWVTARVHLRERRVIGLLFEPLRRWFD